MSQSPAEVCPSCRENDAAPYFQFCWQCLSAPERPENSTSLYSDDKVAKPNTRRGDTSSSSQQTSLENKHKLLPKPASDYRQPQGFEDLTVRSRSADKDHEHSEERQGAFTAEDLSIRLASWKISIRNWMGYLKLTRDEAVQRGRERFGHEEDFEEDFVKEIEAFERARRHFRDLSNN